MRVFPDDREPQHNRGADDKHSLSEDVVCFFFFCFLSRGAEEKREGSQSHK